MDVKTVIDHLRVMGTMPPTVKQHLWLCRMHPDDCFVCTLVRDYTEQQEKTHE